MPPIRTARQNRRRTRLTLLAVTLLVIAGGVGGLYVFQKARNAVPQLPTAERDAAIAQVDRGEYDAALEAFAPYIEANQTTPAMLKAWARARLAVPLPDGAQIAEAVTVLRSVIARNRDDIDAARQLLAVLAEYPQRVETELVDLADRILAADPTDVEAQRGRILGLAAGRQYGGAIVALNDYLLVYPDDLKMQCLMLDMMNGEGQPSGTVLARGQAVADAEATPPVGQVTLAYAKIITGDRTGARPLLGRAIETPTADPRVAMQIVQLLDVVGAHTAVLPYLERTYQAGGDATTDSALVAELILRRFESGRIEPALELLDTDVVTPSLYMKCVRAIALHTAQRRSESTALIDELAAHSTNRYRSAAAVLRAALPALPDTAPDNSAIVTAAREAATYKVNVPYLDAIIADAHQRLGQNDAAEAAYKSALRQRPAWAGPCLGLAGLYLRSGDEAEAYGYAVAAGAREGRTLRVAVMTARAAGARLADLNDAQLAELLDIVNRVQSARPGEPHTAVLKVGLLARQGDLAAATQAARAAAASDPPLNEEATLRLNATARQYNLGLADELEAGYLERFGQTPRIAMARAVETAAGGDPAGALAAFDAATPTGLSGDQAAEWLVNRALLYESVGDPAATERWSEASAGAATNARVQQRVLTSAAVWSDRALTNAAIKRLENADPDDPAWRVERARYLLTGDDPEAAAKEADQLLTRAAQLGPPTVPALVMHATASRLLGDNVAALKQLEQAGRQNPNDASLRIDIAQSLAATGDRRRALSALREVTGQPDLSDSLLRRIYGQLYRLDDLDAAAGTIETLNARGTATAADLLTLARLNRRAGRLDAAAALLPDILANDGQPANAQTIAFAADTYAAAGRPDAARVTLDRLDDLDLTDAQKMTLRAAHAAGRGQLDEAAAGFVAAARADPTNAAAWRNLIEFQLRAGQTAAALQSAADAADATTPGIDALRDQTRIIEALPADSGLTPLYLSVLSENPEDRTAATQALATLNRLRDAEPRALADAFATLADKYPNQEAIEVLAVTTLRNAGDVEASLQRADAARQRFPESAALAQALAEAYARQRNWSQTLIATDRWRGLTGGNTLAADTLAARAHRELGRPDRALEVLAPYRSRILDQPESTPVLTRQYALLLALAGREREARTLLEALLTTSTYWRMTWLDVATQGVRDTRRAGKWLQDVEDVLDESQLAERSAIAQAWWALGLRDNYAPYLQRSRTRLANLAADPGANADVWFFLGTIAEFDDDTTAAADYYRKALELSPNAVNSRNNLAMVLAKTPDATTAQLDEAAKLAGDVVSSNPDNPNYHDTFAAVLFAAGRYDEALAAIQQAIDLDPGNPAWRVRADEIIAAQTAE